MPPITIRESDLSDLAVCSDICVRAFGDGSDFFRALHPPDLREKYPTSVEEGWLNRNRMRLLTPNTVVLVAEEDNKIVAYAAWTRKIGKSESNSTTAPAEKWIASRDGVLKRLERTFTTWQDTVMSYIMPLKGYRKDVLDKYIALAADTEKNFYAPPRDAQWHLDVLAVHPEHQRKGLGRMLTEWGIKKADEEGVICTLESSRVGQGLYKSLGFVSIRNEWLKVEGLDPVLIRFMARYLKGDDDVTSKEMDNPET